MKVYDHISSWFWKSLVRDTWEMPCSHWKVFPKVSFRCSVAVSADENTVCISVATGDEELPPQCNLNLLGFSLDEIKWAETPACLISDDWTSSASLVLFWGPQGTNFGPYRKYKLHQFCMSGFNVAVSWISRRLSAILSSEQAQAFWGQRMGASNWFKWPEVQQC